MRIGIILFSHTGHTLFVSNKLKKELSSKGHEVMLDRLETTVPLTMSSVTAELKKVPNIQPYDAVVLATPVRGGTPSPPMKAFLNTITSFEGKRVVILVTGFFPEKWGRNQTIAELEEILKTKNAQVCGVGSIRWFSLTRGQQIQKAVDHISSLF